jgi:dTMP kinase
VRDGGAGTSANDETAVLPAVPPVSPTDETAVLPAVPDEAEAEDGQEDSGPSGAHRADQAAPGASETTTMITPVVPDPPGQDGGSQEGGNEAPTAELPKPVPGTARTDDPADRVPPWLFRPEQDAQDRTQELPANPGTRRPRPEWAEETPLDDLPSLADELLGPHDEDDESRRRRR